MHLQSTSMGVQKIVPKKQKNKFLKLTCLFLKRSFKKFVSKKEVYYETLQDFTINYPFNSRYGKRIFILAPEALGKLMQLISLEPHVNDLVLG